MTGQEIVDFFEEIVDDSIDQTAALILLNNAKNKLEGSRPWAYLKAIDSSEQASSAAKSLPSNFNRPIDGTIYVDRQPYIQIPFEQQRLFSQSALRWYLDMKNSAYYLLGNNLSGTIYFPYIIQTDDITISTSPLCPARFHPLFAFEMADIFYGIDQGERGAAWDDKWIIQYRLLKASMDDWDIQLQKQAFENSVLPDFEGAYPLEMMG